MKRKAFVCILMVLVISFCAIAEQWIESDDFNGISNEIPDFDLWGISSDALKSRIGANFTTCVVGTKNALRLDDVMINNYPMDVYYLFGAKTWDSAGNRFYGLSKVTYLLVGTKKHSKSALNECYETLCDDMSNKLGKPKSNKNSVATWNDSGCKIEIGKGKFKNYNGSGNVTIAVVFTANKIVKPVTPSPVPRATPVPNQKSSSNSGSEELDYKAVSRYPDQYKGMHVEFTGIVVQAQETSLVKYEGGSLFDQYYVLRVASKYEKYKSIDGYNTDDIIYVVVPTSKVEGGRILDDDKVRVYGRLDGIETYTTILGGSVSLPRIEADRVVIK